ncbi:MAG: hypothetical protein U0O22_09575 [Acutalibacteraceae bacterium]|nr:hypothetical protein [Acutalibacteraceae bacterium]
MEEFYYPDNLNKDAVILVWKARDAVIVFCSLIASFLLFLWTSLYIPLVVSATFAFFTIRLADSDYSVYEYIKTLVNYAITGQQTFFWRIDE